MASFFKKPDLTETMFTLRMTQKQLEKQSLKSEKDSTAQKAKIKKALQQGNVEGAKIYSENCIRKKNEGLNLLRMAARIDAVHNKVQTAMMMQDVTKQMGKVTKGLDSALKTMDLEKIGKTMGEFERVFEELDVHSQVLEGAMSSATTLTTPQDQVDNLIVQVAEENGMDVLSQLAEATPGVGVPTEAKPAAVAEDDDLSRRLAELRQVS